jgi:hypothetical protein
MIIQQLLADAGFGTSRDWFRGTPVVSKPRRLGHSEITGKLHRLRAHRNFTSHGGVVPGKPSFYTIPTQLRLNHWALSGNLTIEEQAARLNTANGQITHRFHARNLHLVMRPAASATSARFHVLLDGLVPGAAQGTEVDGEGYGMLVEQRLYQLIRQRGPVSEHTFEIMFLEPGVEAYAFTFG